MRFELLILLGTVFFIMNVYHDGKYLTMIKSWKKYYQMAFYGFLGLSLFVFIRKYPGHGFSLFKHAHRVVKYMPIDKDSADIITPFLDISSHFSRNNGENNVMDSPQYKRMMSSGSGGNPHAPNRNGSVGGGRTTKRCVSETKKKFVASNQNWKCAGCSVQLPAWFEVDHKVRLDQGGDNHINNLEALCRNCHGKKTSMESML